MAYGGNTALTSLHMTVPSGLHIRGIARWY
jgi:hypothetical protein